MKYSALDKEILAMYLVVKPFITSMTTTTTTSLKIDNSHFTLITSLRHNGLYQFSSVSRHQIHIDGFGHKPSNSEFKQNKKFHKMTRDQVLHHVQI